MCMFVYSTPARNQHDKLTCRTPWWLLGVDVVAASGNLTGNQYAGGVGRKDTALLCEKVILRNEKPDHLSLTLNRNGVSEA